MSSKDGDNEDKQLWNWLIRLGTITLTTTGAENSKEIKVWYQDGAQTSQKIMINPKAIHILLYQRSRQPPPPLIQLTKRLIELDPSLIFMRDEVGFTTLHRLIFNFSSFSEDSASAVQLAHILITASNNYGKKPITSMVDMDGRTPLHLATIYGASIELLLLLVQGTDPSILYTPLSILHIHQFQTKKARIMMTPLLSFFIKHNELILEYIVKYSHPLMVDIPYPLPPLLDKNHQDIVKCAFILLKAEYEAKHANQRDRDNLDLSNASLTQTRVQKEEGEKGEEKEEEWNPVRAAIRSESTPFYGVELFLLFYPQHVRHISNMGENFALHYALANSMNYALKYVTESNGEEEEYCYCSYCKKKRNVNESEDEIFCEFIMDVPYFKDMCASCADERDANFYCGRGYFTVWPVQKRRQAILQKILFYQEEAASIPDGDGSLPIHIALTNKMRWNEGIKDLFDVQPDALNARDMNIFLYPFMLAAVGDFKLKGEFVSSGLGSDDGKVQQPRSVAGMEHLAEQNLKERGGDERSREHEKQRRRLRKGYLHQCENVFHLLLEDSSRLDFAL